MAEHKKRGDLGKSGTKSSKPKGKAKPVKEIHIRRAKTGHIVATHKHHQAPGAEPMEDEEHVVEPGGLDAHVEQHLPAESPESELAMGRPNPQPGGMMGM